MRKRLVSGLAAVSIAVVAASAGLPSAGAVTPAGVVATSVNTPTYELRASLYRKVNAARANYSDSKPIYNVFPPYYAGTYRAVLTRDGKRLNALALKLGAARTYAEHQALVTPITTELSRSVAFKRSTVVASDSFAARAAALSAAQAATRSWLAGTMTEEDLTAVTDVASNIAAWSSADRVRTVAALGSTTRVAASDARIYQPALSTLAPVPTPAGWQPIPGSCALPAAGDEWAGTASTPGLHAWINDAEVQAAQARAADESDTAFAYAHTYLTKFAERVLANPPATTGSDLWLRAQRLGYRWVMNGEEEYRQALFTDLDRLLYQNVSGWPGSSIGDAATLHAAATALDWTRPEGEQGHRYDITLRNLYVSRFACMVDDNYGMTTAHNMSAIHASALFMAGVRVASVDRAQGAAMMKAGWLGMQPTVRALSDGGWYEGPSYWNLLSRFVVGALATAQNVYPSGTPVTVPDLAATATFMGEATAGDGSLPQFGDANNDPLRTSFAFYAGRNRLALPASVAANIRSTLTGYVSEAHQVLWWPSSVMSQTYQPTAGPVSRLFPKTGVAVLHAGDVTAWLKGSSPIGLSHTHLDSGMVHLRANGVQWMTDPGSGNYKAPGYFNISPTSLRWTYWHVGPAAHSSIVGARRPTVGAAAGLSLSGNRMSVNLRATTPGTTSGNRAVTLTNTSMVISDRFVSAKAQTFTWRWVTSATVVSASRSGVVLSKDGKRLVVKFSGLPTGSTITVVTSTEKAYDGNPVRVVTVKTPQILSLALDATATW